MDPVSVYKTISPLQRYGLREVFAVRYSINQKMQLLISYSFLVADVSPCPDPTPHILPYARL